MILFKKDIIKTMIVFFIILLFISNSVAASLVLDHYGSIHLYSSLTYKLMVNGQQMEMDTPLLILDNRAIVPVKFIFEKLGAKISWDSNAAQIDLTLNQNTIQLKINDKKALVNNTPYYMDVPPKIVNNRTFVPLRFISENFGIQVGWYPKEGYISLNQKKYLASNNLNSIKYASKTKNDEIIIDLTNKPFYSVNTSDLNKIIIDFKNTKLVYNQKHQTVNSNFIKNIRCGQFTDDTTRVVIDTIKQKTPVGISESDNSVILNLNNLNDPNTSTERNSTRISRGNITRDANNLDINNDVNVSVITSDDYDDIIISLDDYRNYNVFTIKSPDRIVVDIPNASAPNYEQKIDANTFIIQDVRYIQSEKGYVRVVVDLLDKYLYTMKENSGNLTVRISHQLDNSTKDESNTTIQKSCMIVIDPGHGGSESGAEYNYVNEKDLNLDIAKRLNSLLQQKGIMTVMTRNDDNYVDLFDRSSFANNLNATLFISIHNNAFTEDMNGTETLYSPRDDNNGKFNSKRFAKIIHKS